MENNFDVSESETLPAGTAVYAKVKQRVREILGTASQILAFEGYSNFSRVFSLNYGRWQPGTHLQHIVAIE